MAVKNWDLVAKSNITKLVLYCLTTSRLQQERDSSERESREKETKILSLNRELDEIRDRLEQVERQKATQARELEDLVSSKDDVGKNVSLVFRVFCVYSVTMLDLTFITSS